MNLFIDAGSVGNISRWIREQLEALAVTEIACECIDTDRKYLSSLWAVKMCLHSRSYKRQSVTSELVYYPVINVCINRYC